MTDSWKVSSPLLSKMAAVTLAAAFEAAMGVEQAATSLFCVQEGHDIWKFEAYFAETPDRALLKEIFGALVFEIERLSDTNWVAYSLSQLEPIRAGRFFLHGSHDHHLRQSGGVNIEMDAGLAFGTGHHATTLGCLLALDTALKIKRPNSALDVGCGSGVLAIAAALAAHIPVLATDIDPAAIDVARQNARTNKIGPHVRALIADGVNHRITTENGPYGLVMANILAGPLMQMSNSLSNAVEPGGDLILSGLLTSQEPRIVSAYRQAGLFLQRRFQQDAWSTLQFSRP